MLTEPWQVLFLPPALWRALIHHSPNKASNAQTSSDTHKRLPWCPLTYSHEDAHVSCWCAATHQRKSSRCCHQSRCDKTSGVRFYAITHVLYQASLPVTEHNEEWSPRTHKGRRRSSLPAKTYSESMCRCNNIAIHLGWYCSSHVTSLATDLSDKSLSALAALVREVLQEVSRQHSLLAAGQAEATWQILLALIQQNYRINRGRPHLLTS